MLGLGSFCCFVRSCSLETEIAVQPFNRSATVIAAGLAAHRRIGSGVIDMGHFSPRTFFWPVPCVLDAVMFDYLAPTAAAAFRA